MREPGDDDHLGDETYLDLGWDESGNRVVVRRHGLPPDGPEPPLLPICPVLPDAYLRWRWSTTEGAIGRPQSSAEVAALMGCSVRDVRWNLRDLARWTRLRQYRLRHPEPEGVDEAMRRARYGPRPGRDATRQERLDWIQAHPVEPAVDE